jgi:branched-chain amino acid transport system ATP-binding protein
MPEALRLSGLRAGYGETVILEDVALELPERGSLAVLGRNGVGKTTLLATIMGHTTFHSGEIEFGGSKVQKLPVYERVRLGIGYVPQGREIFPSLSVEENLMIGAYGRHDGGYWSLARIYELFPALAARRRAPSHTLSGGEQQMAAIGRALMANPRVLLCDEVSLGLAPVVIRNIYAALPRIKASGASVILVEQDIVQALQVANRVYCFQEGRMSLEGRPAELSRDQIHTAYFGA